MELTNREKALHLAITFAPSVQQPDPLILAQRFLEFLEGRDAGAPPEPIQPKKRKPSTPVTIDPAQQVEGAVEGAQPALDPDAAGKAVKPPDKDDVRRALTALQNRKNKEASMVILGKYAPTKTLGSLPEEKYATVIAECKKAAEAA